MNALEKISLTGKQSQYVEAILSGCDPHEAARRAGYADPANSVYYLLRAPAVVRAVELGLRRVLHGELVPLAFKTLTKLVQEADSDRVKLDAARIILDRAGFVPAKQAPEAGEREPEAMSTGELHALIERLERELGDRSKPVSEPSEAQAIEDAEIIEP